MFLFAVLFAAAATITIGPLLVVLLSGTIIPILTGLVTKSGASASLKQAVTVVLAGVAGLIQSSLVGGAAVFSTDTLILAAASWLVSIALYHGVYQSHDLNESLAPDVGLGAIETTGRERV